jgi:hypothetical protein
MRTELSEEEADLMHETLEEFWIDFGKLVAEKLNKLPKDLEFFMLMRMQERASVYGTAYPKHIDDSRPETLTLS